MTTDRCPTCDKPRAGDVAVSHADGCACPGCLSVCWRDWGVLCEPADWRARAIAAESDAQQWRKAVAGSQESGDPVIRAIAALLACTYLDKLPTPADDDFRRELAVSGRIAHDARRADAARWRKVAPLIEAMREAAKVAHHDYATEDDATVNFRVTGHELIDAVTNILAATKEP